jgi:hypothetical protein
MFDTPPVQSSPGYSPSAGTTPTASQAQAPPVDQLSSSDLDQLNQHFLLVAQAVSNFSQVIQQVVVFSA